MKNEVKFEKKINRDIIVFIIGCLLYVIGCISIFSITVVEAAIVCGTICVIVLLSWIFANNMLKNFLDSGKEGRKSGLFEASKELMKNVYCVEDNSIVCPLNVGFNEDGLNFKINKTTSERNRLYEKDTVDRIEDDDKREKRWRDIWIFSQNLSSEIVNDAAEDVVVKNIKTYKTNYTFFYLNRKDQTGEVEDRKEKLVSSIPEQDRAYLSFVPIDVSNGYLGKNTLPLLCGSILFSQNKRGSLPNFTEGYLSIRKDNKDIPIYYKMPRCMLREYANFFKAIIIKNNKNKGGQL